VVKEKTATMVQRLGSHSERERTKERKQGTNMHNEFGCFSFASTRFSRNNDTLIFLVSQHRPMHIISYITRTTLTITLFFHKKLIL
jgi:hypothetical protein